MRAPLPKRETQRLEALDSYDLVDTLPEGTYDDLVSIASTICRTPIALLSLIDEKRQFFKARVGLDATETSRDVAFCAHAILQTEPFTVADATQDPRFVDNPLVTGDPSIRFYVGVPLVNADGHALGTLCAIDRVPRQLDEDQMHALRALSRQVMTHLELRRSLVKLERALASNQAARSPVAERARSLLAEGRADHSVEERIRSLLARMDKLQR